MPRICVLGLCLLTLMGCAAGSERVEISVVNHTDLPLVASLEAGILSRQVVLWPHVPQVFQVPRELMPSKVLLVLTGKEIK